MSVSLYRRFRPDTFAKVIGQDHIVRVLTNQIATGRISHAYLFTGTRGTGKTSTAKIFARAVNCLQPIDGSPCGECEVCKALANPANLDIIEMDAASNNGVDEIRDLKEKVMYRPSVGKYKVYIIDEVHMLSISAFNALLKTLEEPPAHVIFILATTEVHKLPQTILSRCQRFDFSLVSEKTLEKHLKNILKELGRKADDRALALVARHGEGSVRDSISILDMLVSYTDGELMAEDVEQALGLSSFDLLTRLAEEILDEDIAGLLRTIRECLDQGKNITNLAKDLGVYFLRLMSIRQLSREEIELTDTEYAMASAVATKADAMRLAYVIKIVSSIEGQLRYTTQPHILFTALLVEAASPQIEGTPEMTLSRLRTVEKKVNDICIGAVTVATATETPTKAPTITEASIKSMEMLKSKSKRDDKVVVKDDRAIGVWKMAADTLKQQNEYSLAGILAVCDSVQFEDGDKLIFYTDQQGVLSLLSDDRYFIKVKEAVKLSGASDFEVRDSRKKSISASPERMTKLTELFGDGVKGDN